MIATAAPRIDRPAPDYARELDEVRRLAKLLDTRWKIPGIGVRFGIDPVLGLIPGAGDLVAGAISTYVIVKAHRLGAPKSMLVKMAGNVAVDTVVGAVPILGSVFDLFYKASTRNLRLLQTHLEDRNKI
jgi:NAD/NADP transhydrogenase beta subunit